MYNPFREHELVPAQEYKVFSLVAVWLLSSAGPLLIFRKVFFFLFSSLSSG
jgi:hypothetical protein